MPPGQAAPAEPEPLPRRDFLAPGDPAASAASTPAQRARSSVFERRRPAPPSADATEPLPERIQPLPSRAAAEPREPSRRARSTRSCSARPTPSRAARPAPCRTASRTRCPSAAPSSHSRSAARPSPCPSAAPPSPCPSAAHPEPAAPARRARTRCPSAGPSPCPSAAPPPTRSRSAAAPSPSPSAAALPTRCPPRNGSLPRRTGRSQRAGRHRSPHRLSVASDAPALILAVPGSATGPYVRGGRGGRRDGRDLLPGRGDPGRVPRRGHLPAGGRPQLRRPAARRHPLNSVHRPAAGRPAPAIDAAVDPGR